MRNKSGKVQKLFPILKVGMLVKIKLPDIGNLKGIIGEKSAYNAYIHHNNKKLNCINGTIRPENNGYKYSYAISKSGSYKIDIINYNWEARFMENGVKCDVCNDKFIEEDVKIVDEVGNYCLDCYKEFFKKCCNCDEMVHIDDIKKVDGEIYCTECFDDNFTYCSNCDEIVNMDDSMFSERDDSYYCSSCYNDRFRLCANCDAELVEDEQFVGSDDNTYCEECWGERYGSCYNCGNTFRLDDLSQRESDGHYYCSQCIILPERIEPPVPQGYVIPSSEDEERKYVHDYGFRPEPLFNKMQYEKLFVNNNLYLGLELEVQHPEYNTDKAKILDTFLKEEKENNYFYLKRDGSVKGGFEIVSHPFTLAYAHKELKICKMIEFLKSKGFTSEETGKCGLHIHVSRDFFEDLDITKLRLFFLKNKDKLYKFSNRKGVGDNFCLYEDLKPKDIINGYEQSGRYWALNLNSSRDTIEFRLFRGTLSYNRILAILQFSEAISYFVKEHGITSFLYGERQYKNNSWGLFTDWARETNKYKDMINYFKKEELICA